jgi:hypothetical protein
MANKIFGGYSLGVASERLTAVNKAAHGRSREPTWYFLSKLLVSYAPRIAYRIAGVKKINIGSR